MIEFLKMNAEKLEYLDKPKDDCWINLINPTAEEIEQTRKLVEFPDEIITSLKDIDELPTLDEYEKFTFIIIRTPYNEPSSELVYVTHPLGILLNDKYVITICFWENDAITRLKSHKFEFRKSQLVLRLLFASAKIYLAYLKDINKQLYKVEAELEKSHKNKEIMNFLTLQKDLVYFSTSLRLNDILAEKLAKHDRLIKSKDHKKLMEDVMDEQDQALQMVEIYSNILSSTLDAFASIISNNLNIVMKNLTAITLIFSIPMLIASIYGMNVALPYGHSPYAFIIVMSFSVMLSMTGIYVFYRSRLL